MNKYFAHIIIVIFVLPWFIQATAQETWKQHKPDEVFSEARQLAFGGNREKAREMLLYILEGNPEYHDARVLLGRTFAWEQQWEKARQAFNFVLDKDPKYKDAYNALTDTEIWSENYHSGLDIVNTAIEHYPNSEDFFYKKGLILHRLERNEEAVLVLNQLMDINPAHKNGAALIEEIKIDRLKYTLSFNYGLDLFSRYFKPAHYAFIQLSRNNSWGTGLIRINYSNRFGHQGYQPEIDLYPRIAEGVYAYLNYGYSSSTLFPEHRVGGELYSKVANSFEGSLGLRYLYFNPVNTVTMFTGSLNWYFASYWLSLRPYVAPDNAGISTAGMLALRKYFKNRQNYLGFKGGFGYSPDFNRIQSASGLSSDEIYLLKSQRVGMEWQKSLEYNLLLNARVEFIRQELIFDQGEFVVITSSELELKWRF